MQAFEPDKSNGRSDSTFRILDANFNRAREALRVVENYARFCLDSSHLTARLKDIRHRLRQAVELLDAGLLLESRDTDLDVGTSISVPEEFQRTTTEDVVTSNLKRLQESLRTLEEFSKPISPEAASIIEQIRYESYTLEKVMLLAQARRPKLEQALLYVIVTESIGKGRPAPQIARDAVAGGADIIQLREKDRSGRDLLQLASEVCEVTHEGGALFIVNDRPDIALLSHADGVHLGQEDIPLRQVRRLVGDEMIIGISTRNKEQAIAAERNGADYIGVGPVYETATKPGRRPAGLDHVRFVSKNIQIPHFAIGGLHIENIGAVLDAGARAICVCSEIIAADDVEAAARSFKEVLK